VVRHTTVQMMSRDDDRRQAPSDTLCGIGKALSVCLFLCFNGHFPGGGYPD